MRRVAAICLGLAAWSWTAGVAPAPGEELFAAEYKLKATFLYHFTEFGKWPDTAFENAASPFVIGVLGQDPFGQLLDRTVQGKTVQDRRLEIRRFTGIEKLARCHVLFVSASERNRLAEVFAKLGDSPVLTVGDTPEFLDRGGMIDFAIRGERVQFDIRPEPAERVGIKLSSQLMKLAKRQSRP